jgi:hypothetical protein
METSMSSSASTAGWHSGPVPQASGRRRGRGLEIAGIVLGFIFVWPAALAYLVWKVMGYPVPNQWKSFLEQNFTRLNDPFRGVAAGFANATYRPTGNLAFEEHRRAELARLEEERRRLDEEARAFGEFVEELKRAKDREEFEAFMAKRRGTAA